MENLAMMSGNLFSGVLLLIIGLIVQTGKTNFMVAGYNTMNESEQEKWNARAMSKFIGWVVLVIPSAVLLLACIPMWMGFFPNLFLLISWVIFTVILIWGVIHVNVSPRFKKENQ